MTDAQIVYAARKLSGSISMEFGKIVCPADFKAVVDKFQEDDFQRRKYTYHEPSPEFLAKYYKSKPKEEPKEEPPPPTGFAADLINFRYKFGLSDREMGDILWCDIVKLRQYERGGRISVSKQLRITDLMKAHEGSISQD